MAPSPFLRRLADHPAIVCGVVALALRTLLVLHAWQTNPLVVTPQLDGPYYMEWAADIADGDLLGRSGIVGGAPWMLNPLYAYFLAPFARWFVGGHFPVLLAQAVLGAATTALVAASARRFFDVRAAWVAGVLVAFAAPLAQLDAHIAVAELSAFFVAGACFACAPRRDGDSAFAHGPVAAGLWLGIGALARPITPLALPFVAWRFTAGTPRRWRTGALVVAVFVACAVPSLLRNRIVSGESAVYTAAGGINAHLGNNWEARKFRSMTSPHIQFSPTKMHGDAARYVQEAVGHRPTPGEISSFFWRKTIDECVQHPLESAAHYANKARWFFGPLEVPSSASFATDREFSPFLAFAFVPAWLIAALAAAGAWAHRRRADVLLGPGALALAHWAMLTLVFPLSHYRAPAIPALAVLAGGAVAAAWTAWAADRRAAVCIVCVGGAAAFAGACPPGPDALRMRDEAIVAQYHWEQGDLAEAERHAWAALEESRRQWGEDSSVAWELIGDLQDRQRKFPEALASLTRALQIQPKLPLVLVLRSKVNERLNDLAAAERDARDVVRTDPYMWQGHLRLAEVLSLDPSRYEEAAAALARAIELGCPPVDPALMRRVRPKR